MTTKIRGWIGKHRGEQLNDTWRYSWDLPVSKEKMYPDDICIELTIVSPQQLEREAEGIKAIELGKDMHYSDTPVVKKVKAIDEEMK